MAATENISILGSGYYPAGHGCFYYICSTALNDAVDGLPLSFCPLPAVQGHPLVTASTMWSGICVPHTSMQKRQSITPLLNTSFALAVAPSFNEHIW